MKARDPRHRHARHAHGSSHRPYVKFGHTPAYIPEPPKKNILATGTNRVLTASQQGAGPGGSLPEPDGNHGKGEWQGGSSGESEIGDARRRRQAAGSGGGDRPDRPRLRQGLGDEAGQERRDRSHSFGFDRIVGPRHGAGHRRPAARPGDRGVRAGKLGQDDPGPAHRGRNPEGRRHRRLCRRRTCARPRLCPEAGRQPRRPAGVAARYG